MGVVVLDAGVIIAILESADAHHGAARAAVRDALDRGDQLCLPVSAYAAALVRPFVSGGEAADTVDHFLDEMPATVEAATRDIARRASELRAEHGRSLRLPDALVVATAIDRGASLIVTTDRGWPTLPVRTLVL